MKLVACSMVVTLAVAAGPARADKSNHDDDVSPAVAEALSFGVTAVGAAAMIAGSKTDTRSLTIAGAVAFAIGPTTGHLYAGEWFNSALGFRIAGAALVGSGIAFKQMTDTGNPAVGIAAVVGLLLYTGGMVSEIGSSQTAARTANERRHAATITVTPVVTPDGTAALSFAGSF